MKIHISSSFLVVIPAESKFRMIEIESNLKKMNFEHVDLENYNNIAEPSLFRNRPAPIVIEDKKNKEEQTDVQQTILDAEMETERIIKRTNFFIIQVYPDKIDRKNNSGKFDLVYLQFSPYMTVFSALNDNKKTLKIVLFKCQTWNDPLSQKDGNQ